MKNEPDYKKIPGGIIQRFSRNIIDISVTAKPKWEQWILLRSDVHHDNPKCRHDLEKKHLEQAKQRNAWIIDNGDLFCAMQGKWDKRADKSAIREEHQGGNYLDLLIEEAAKFYKPYAQNFIVLGRGNHETAIRKNHETDLTDRLAATMNAYGSPVLTSGYSGWIRFKIKFHTTVRDTILLHHYHGSGGGGPVTLA